MKKILLLFTVILSTITAVAQSDTLFCGTFVNDEFQIFLKLDATGKSITVPGQDIYGELPGYLGSKRDSRLWLVLDSEIVDANTVDLQVINDYGSEDFKARLKHHPDGTYTWKHLGGSVYKIVVSGKYVKIPSKVVFKKE